MDPETLTPERVQAVLRLVAGIEVDLAEAARVLPWAVATRRAAAAIERFDVAEVRSAGGFDPTGPYR